MISMRYHIVSLAAVFLALALGIVLGATKISSPLLSGLQSDNQSLTSQQQELSSTNTDLTNRVTGDDKFAGVVGQLAVRGTLPKTTVVLITTADADPADRDAVLSLLNRAGATVTAQIQVTKDFTDPARADELRSLAAKSLPTGATLPEVPQVGAVAGGLLGSVIVVKPDGSGAANPDQAAAALAALAAVSARITPTTPVSPSEPVRPATRTPVADFFSCEARSATAAARSASEPPVTAPPVRITTELPGAGVPVTELKPPLVSAARAAAA